MKSVDVLHVRSRDDAPAQLRGKIRPLQVAAHKQWRRGKRGECYTALAVAYLVFLKSVPEKKYYTPASGLLDSASSVRLMYQPFGTENSFWGRVRLTAPFAPPDGPPTPSPVCRKPLAFSLKMNLDRLPVTPVRRGRSAAPSCRNSPPADAVAADGPLSTHALTHGK